MEPLRRIVKTAKRSGAGASYLAPYEAAARRHGASFEATLWASRDGQIARFRVISEMAELEGRVVVDAGSGCGDFATFLRDQGIHVARYIGLEGVAEVAHAACGCAAPGAEFQHVDFVKDETVFERLAPDVVVFSGSLNTFDQRDALAVLDRAWRALTSRPAPSDAPRALVFNFLSDRCSEALLRQSTSPAHRFDTLALLDWAFERTSHVRFRQDYFPEGHDATIAMIAASSP